VKAEKQQNKVSDTKLRRGLRVGYVVFGVLAGIKIIEYAIASRLHIGNWPYILILALISVSLIIYFYKHISQLWRPEDN
jgi:hypothetical protein